MARKRSTDATGGTWYRSDRFTENNGEWFFVTREGTIEGPFDSRMAAQIGLEKYIGIESSGLLESESTSELSILPAD